MLDNDILDVLVYDYDITKEDIKHLNAIIDINETAKKYSKAFEETYTFKIGQDCICIDECQDYKVSITHDGEWRYDTYNETYYVSLTLKGISKALRKKYCLENDISVDTNYTLDVLNAFVKTADKAVRDYEDTLGHTF